MIISFNILSSTVKLICLDNCPEYILPNIFTPNNDNFNELFIPIPPTRFVKSSTFKLYNRWGKEIFKTNDIFINWNGNGKNGSPIPDGVYYYSAEVEFYRLKKEDESKSYNGWIQLVR